MDFEKFQNDVKEKLQFSDEEWQGKIDEVKEEMKAFDFNEAQLEQSWPSRVYSKYRKQLLSNAKLYEGMLLSASEPTDFGAARLKKSIEEKFKISDDEMKQQMIDEGVVDASGNPCWHPDYGGAKWKHTDDKGNLRDASERIIVPEREIQQPCWGLFAEMKDGKATTFHKARVTLYGDKIDKDVPLFRKVRVRLNGKFDDERKAYSLNSASVTEFAPTGDEELKYEEYIKILDKYFPDNILNLESDDVMDLLKGATDKSPLFITNALAIRVAETSGRSNVMEIASMAFGLDEDKQNVTCWVPKHIPLPPEAMGQMIVCGRLGASEGKYTVNVDSVFNKLKIKRPAPVAPVEEEKEETPAEEEKKEGDGTWGV